MAETSPMRRDGKAIAVRDAPVRSDRVLLDILTPLGPTREGVEVEGVELPGLLGEMGVLPGHEALITAVVPGVVRFREGGQSVRIAVGSGFVEVAHDNRVAILVERAVESGDIDAAAVRRDLDEARRELGDHKEAVAEASYQVAQHKVAWCEAQVRAAAG